MIKIMKLEIIVIILAVREHAACVQIARGCAKGALTISGVVGGLWVDTEKSWVLRGIWIDAANWGEVRSMCGKDATS